jgi:threonine dehydrogenase-like Zn-dependent dehydrogenase
MRQLTFVAPRVLEWHEVPAPRLEGGRQALVAPVAATPCDLDRSLIKGRAPYPGPIALGHEFVARVVDAGDGVRGVAPGELVVVPAHISCGECERCRAGSTGYCRTVPPASMYGLGPLVGDWGGGFSDLVRVPFADAMLVRLPAGVAPDVVAAAGDNLTNAFEVVVPHLERAPGASVLVAGVGATGLYTIQMARAAGAGRIDYLDHDRGRLALAERLGATTIVSRRGEPAPTIEREYEIAVDARGEPEDLARLPRALAPRGVCTSVSVYFGDVALPVFEMLRRGARFEATRTNVRAHLDRVLALVQAGDVAPGLVTSQTLPWEALPEALVEPTLKPVFVRAAA